EEASPGWLAVDGDDRKKQQNEARDDRVTERAKPVRGGLNNDRTHHDNESKKAGNGNEKQLLQRRKYNRDLLPIVGRRENEIAMNEISGRNGDRISTAISLPRADFQHDARNHDAQHHQSGKRGKEADVTHDDRHQHRQEQRSNEREPVK